MQEGKSLSFLDQRQTSDIVASLIKASILRCDKPLKYLKIYRIVFNSQSITFKHIDLFHIPFHISKDKQFIKV